MTEAIEAQIGQWRLYLEKHRALSAADVDELEGHLRDQIDELRQKGLTQDEAFLIAVKRLGNLDQLAREFAREHSERLWKQFGWPTAGEPVAKSNRSLLIALGWAVAAALAVKLPALFAVQIAERADFYLPNASFFALPFLTGYFAWERKLPARAIAGLAVPFVALAVLINTYPFIPGGSTLVLATIHLPIVLWLVMGVAYTGMEWHWPNRRMDFIRFTGEWFVYYVLIALGGGVLTVISMGVFAAIGVDIGQLASEWILPCGAVGAVVVAGWLVEAKQSAIENIAPVLTRVFTPLFTVLLLVFIGALIWDGNGLDIDRDLLVLFDLLLVVVLGLVLYALSARDPLAPADTFDRLQWLLLTCALLVDLVVLGNMVARVSQLGWSPNRVAALGLNLVLLGNLAWSARLSWGFLRGRRPLAALEDWQTTYVPVYAAWAATVVVVLPPAFVWK